MKFHRIFGFGLAFFFGFFFGFFCFFFFLFLLLFIFLVSFVFLKNEIFPKRKTWHENPGGNAGREPTLFPSEYRVMSAPNHPPDGVRRPSVDAAITSINARRIILGHSTTNPTPHSRRLERHAGPSRVLVDAIFPSRLPGTRERDSYT